MASWRVLSRLVVCAIMVFGLGVAMTAGTAQSAQPGDVQPSTDTEKTFLLRLPNSPGAGFSSRMPIGEKVYTMEWAPRSVRASNYRVLIQRQDGTLEEVGSHPIRTLRGSARENPNIVAAGSLSSEGLSAVITVFEQDQVARRFALQPISGKREHVIRPVKDIATHATDIALALPFDDAPPGRRIQGAGACGTGMCVAEIACDADFEYFQDYGSIAAVENQINNVVNTMNIQYERDVSITHVITAIIVRTSEPDPYTATDPNNLLNQFRDQWINQHGNIQRDVAQLFTGKDLNSSVIGIAWLNAVCTSFGYGVVQSDFNGVFGCATDLSAHELGHNWGADHCSCSSHTMNPSITCANQFHPTSTIPDIVAFRDSRSCLDGGISGCDDDADCDDGDLCNGIETCDLGSGQCDPGNPVICDDGDACTIDSCNPTTGACSNNPVNCDDGNACNGAESCDPVSGDCQPGTPVDCDDGDVCTDDLCNFNSGACAHDPISCDDGNPCTLDDCDAGIGCIHSDLAPCCGNASCELGEDCNSCSDDCFSAVGGACGNGICEPADGEDCLSCPADCNGKQNGKPDNRFCCGDGDGRNPVACSDPRCTSQGFECSDLPGASSCCGDLICEGSEDGFNCEVDCGPPPVCGDATCDAGEDPCNCPQDCGTPSAGETNCSDGADEDCDGDSDCNDSDCDGDPACPSCLPKHAACSSNSECCSGVCKPNGTCR